MHPPHLPGQVSNRLKSEMHRYLLYFIFLSLLLSAFTDYERLLLAGSFISYFPYGYAIVEAMILAKVIVVGEAFNIGNRFANRSLIIPVIYKTIIFSILIIIFSVIEHFASGMIKGKPFTTIYQDFSQANLNVILSKTFIMLFVFILFFSFLELSRVLGQGELFNLFFRRNKADHC